MRFLRHRRAMKAAFAAGSVGIVSVGDSLSLSTSVSTLGESWGSDSAAEGESSSGARIGFFFFCFFSLSEGVFGVFGDRAMVERETETSVCLLYSKLLAW